MSALDRQVGGDHYRDGQIQPVQYIEANGLGFLEGCVVKRLTRHGKPTGKGKQDILKAIHELQLLLELRYPEDAGSILGILGEMSKNVKDTDRVTITVPPVGQAPNSCHACGKPGGHGGLQCPTMSPSAAYCGTI